MIKHSLNFCLLGLLLILLSGCASVPISQGVTDNPTEVSRTYPSLTQTQKDAIEAIRSARILRERVQIEAEEAMEKAALEREQREKTYYVGPQETALRLSLTGETQKNIKQKTQLIITDFIQDELGVTYGLVSHIAGEPTTGYVLKADLVKDLSHFIVYPDPLAYYGAMEKSPDYPSNPRIQVKALYVSQVSFTSSKLDELIKIANETEINAFVIDIKDDFGNVLFHSKAAEQYVPEANGKSGIQDIEPIMQKLKDNGIYTIGRIVTFREPRYARRYPEKAITFKTTGDLYSQGDGLPWSSAYDETLWAYTLAVCKEAADLGFNEIQFDYVRFPATGALLDKQLDFKNQKGMSKVLAIQSFLLFAREELKGYSVYITADVFGWAASDLTDVQIGQHWETVSNVVDYMAPMMYPSHYGPNNFGIPVPDADPYGTLLASGRDAQNRNANLMTPALIRPWIQDFTASWVKGYIPYRSEQLRAQIDALEELGINEFMIWNPSNRYSIKGLKKEE